VAASIPLSLITAFGLIRIFDFTLNTMSLLGLPLAIGVVIDDAIMVLEQLRGWAGKAKTPSIESPGSVPSVP